MLLLGTQLGEFFGREELLLLKEESDSKVRSLERQCGDLQSAIQQLSEDFHKVRFANASLLRMLPANLHYNCGRHVQKRSKPRVNVFFFSRSERCRLWNHPCRPCSLDTTASGYSSRRSELSQAGGGAVLWERSACLNSSLSSCPVHITRLMWWWRRRSGCWRSFRRRRCLWRGACRETSARTSICRSSSRR